MSARSKAFPRLRESKFRGNSTWKLLHANLKPEETFRIISRGPEFKPVDVIASLRDLSRISSPSYNALSVLANRCLKSSAQFFPPQILESLQLFSAISFSKPELFEFFASRKDDLLNDASPKRIVHLIVALSELYMPIFHVGIWEEIRRELVRLLPQLKRGIPSVIRALTHQGCPDEELILGLLKQAELNYLTNEIEGEIFVASIEAASRSGLPAVKKEVGRIISELLAKNFSRSNKQSIELLVACSRVGSMETVEKLEKNLQTMFANTASTDGCRGIELMARLGASLSTSFSPTVLDYVESTLQQPDWGLKFSPFILHSLARMGADEFVSFALTKIAQLDNMSAEKLFHLYRASHLVSNSEASEIFLHFLNPLARHLTPRQARLLWECTPGLTAVHALPMLLRSGREHHNIETEIVGPYMLEKRGDTKSVLRVAHHLAGRREIEFRRSAIERWRGKDGIVSLEFSEF